MVCGFEELRRREVIDISDGERLGFIDDVRIDLGTSAITALVIFGRPRIFGIFGRADDIVIPCGDIRVVGSEVILVKRSITPELSHDTNISVKGQECL